MRRAACAVVVVVVVIVAAEPADAEKRPHVPRGFSVVDPIDEARVIHEENVADFEAWFADQLRLVDEFVRAVIAGERLRTGPPSPGPASVAHPGGGGCYDGPVPAYIVDRESGGDPGAVNPSSGAFGCFQFLPSTWSSSCSDLARDVAGQVECANRISDGGTNLAPWSATR